MSSVPLDVKYAFRQIRHKPGTALLVMLTLGTAIGLVTSLFAVINTMVFKPWPVKEPAGLVRIASAEGFSLVEWRSVAAAAKSVTGLLANDGGLRNGAVVEGRRVTVDFVSTNYFRVLGVALAAGRGFLPEEDPWETNEAWEAPQQVAVISHDVWMGAFGGDAGIVGRAVPVKIGDDEASYKVVGVAPPGFQGTSVFRVDLWVPLGRRFVFTGHKSSPSDPRVCCRVAGRLAPGTSREQAQAELQILSDRFRSSVGRRPLAVGLTGATNLAHDHPGMLREFVLPFVAVGFILLLAYANAGNILLARAQARRQEIAVRLALGASRGRLVRQLLTEALVLAGGAGVLGVGIAFALARMLIVLNPMMSHLRLQLAPDHRVLAFALALAGLACVASGLAPALHATRSSVSRALHNGPGWITRGFSLREGLLAVQIALCVTLLVPAAMLERARPLATTRGLDFDPDRIHATRIELPSAQYDDAHMRVFRRELLDGLAAAPYARSVAVADYAPFGGTFSAFRLRRDAPGHGRRAVLHQVSDTYFDVVHARVLAGRNLRATDPPDQVVVVNEALARATWPGETAIGQTVLVQNQALEVVGVVRDANVRDLAGITPAVYRPLQPDMVQIVLTHGAGTGTALSTLVARIDPHVRTVTTPLSAVRRGRDAGLRLALKLLAMNGAIALSLAAFGLFGVFTNAVQERTREIGIRMAIGARPADVFRATFATTARALAVGIVVGTITAVAGGYLLRHFFHGLGAADPIAYLWVALALTLAGTAATYLPAQRALRVDPAVALRCE